MTDPTPARTNPALPYLLRPGEAVYLDMRAEWRRFLPIPSFADRDYAEDADSALYRELVEGSREWRHLLPDRIDRDLMGGADDEDEDAEMEYDDGTPVYYMPRKLMTFLILLALLALLAYEFYGLFVHPTPGVPHFPTPNVPLSRV